MAICSFISSVYAYLFLKKLYNIIVDNDYPSFKTRHKCFLFLCNSKCRIKAFSSPNSSSKRYLFCNSKKVHCQIRHLQSILQKFLKNTHYDCSSFLEIIVSKDLGSDLHARNVATTKSFLFNLVLESNNFFVYTKFTLYVGGSFLLKIMQIKVPCSIKLLLELSCMYVEIIRRILSQRMGEK